MKYNIRCVKFDKSSLKLLSSQTIYNWRIVLHFCDILCISIVTFIRRASDALRCSTAFSISSTISMDSESHRKRTCWTNHRLRWNNDEWLMRRLQPPPCQREGRGSIGQDAAVLRCAMCHPPVSPLYPLSCIQARYSLSVRNCIVLSASFILNTSCRMNAAVVLRRRNASLGIKGFVLLLWRRVKNEGRGGDEIWIALSSCHRTTGGSLNCRNRAADNLRRLTIDGFMAGIALGTPSRSLFSFQYISRKFRARV